MLLAKCLGIQLPEERQQKSVFDERSEESSAQQYFQVHDYTSSIPSCIILFYTHTQWYAHFWQQQNMLQVMI